MIERYGPMGYPSSSSKRWPERPHLPSSYRHRQLGGASRPSVIERGWSAWWGGSGGGGMSQRAQMVESAEKRLFRAIVTNPSHVLHHTLPKEKSTVYNLRPRAHNFELPRKDARNFLARQLYSCPKQS